MKMLRHLKLSLAALSVTTALLSSVSLCAATTDSTKSFEQSKPLRIAVVSFKTCVEKSKLGQKEQAAFDAMKKQMEAILVEKEKTVMEVAGKFNDIDYLDSLSPEAEAELKRQYRTQTQEFTQQQNQFYQTLSQANVLIVQKLTEEVTKASAEVAKNNKIDLVLTDDSNFYNAPSLDISDLVIATLDTNFDKEATDNKPGAPVTDIKK